MVYMEDISENIWKPNISCILFEQSDKFQRKLGNVGKHLAECLQFGMSFQPGGECWSSETFFGFEKQR